MNLVLLTQDQGAIIGKVAWLLGKIMAGIFNILDIIGIPNIGLSIIIFTIVVNLLMLPLTIKQQKFSKLNIKMRPEIQAIQKKYKGKKDNESMMAQNQEMQELYAKYGVSASGSCVQLLIQMPILFALYRVIAAVPAYVTKVKDAFMPLVNLIIDNEESIELVKGFRNSSQYLKGLESAIANGNREAITNRIVDCLNKASTADLNMIAEKFQNMELAVNNTIDQLSHYNNFLGLNIGNSPSFIIKESFKSGMYGILILAILIPILSALSQIVNMKLMPQPSNDSDDPNQDAMNSYMRGMNTVMPIFSAWLCFSLPCGMGIYWTANSVVRTIIMIIINRSIDRMDIDELIKKNEKKNQKKLEKMKQQQELMSQYASMNTKNISNRAQYNNSDVADYREINTSKENSTSSSGGNSMRDKVNMVKKYNEKNNK